MTLIMGLVFVWFIFVILFSKWIRKFNLYLYGICIVIAAILFTQETNIVNMGYVGLSFFILVMFASTLSQGTIRKKLMGNRAELAVMGSIFSLSHGLKYLIFAFDFTFFWRAPIYFYIGIASVVVMLPLAITSIMIIRKKMKGKDWKKLHKLSYLFYGLVATHLLLINNERFLFYVILFGLYVIYRVLALIQKQPIKPKEKIKIA
ncbi:MAG: hypothetical protein A2Y45_08875 [Tenericutes bacterium GWC2_34_14]|nr:MAG: hypothetical protein A2Y45_08875 [Tenericutes bacterium GWC2_34_14]OHE34982.1 MAG: hypothetical protein A2012_02485 [Tenericutes bacterium GWE2_34_108]OHE37158.1 MAG: hypothetical protein A2Y46_00525 [Tenericutes bacterium GWF1_35_14]OHE39710.1 MAG: hypothetical protein A2Y44_02335 [Tenericutes bacterium GWF2_35_184]OHE44102.1 MAG: hypothetical protein A2221_03175 [Tenericutes bacterium RIFOXYA2_FULL_36_32]OHE44648.1 MAG: hypothetical protein A3K26_05400 [Tenericutes bacterium RIFOXYA1